MSAGSADYDRTLLTASTFKPIDGAAQHCRTRALLCRLQPRRG